MNNSQKAVICTALVLAMIAAGGKTALASSAHMTDSDQQAYTLHVSDISDPDTAVQSRASLPSGAYKMSVNINGRRVLQNRVYGIGGTTYVPMFKFCDWLGSFTYSYDRPKGTAYVSGDSLSISATEGELYIVANGRCFYTVDRVIDINGEIYVPIRPLTKALNSRVEWSNTDGEYKVYSGDTRLLRTAAQVYRDDEIYWLSRIINAEAGAEPMQGKLAVGNAILNRTRSSAFPNTIYSVIFDRRYGVQFSPVSNGTVYNTPDEDSIAAAKMCIEGYSLYTDVLYFFNPRISPSNWISQNRRYAFTVGNHVFYY